MTRPLTFISWTLCESSCSSCLQLFSPDALHTLNASCSMSAQSPTRHPFLWIAAIMTTFVAPFSLTALRQASSVFATAAPLAFGFAPIISRTMTEAPYSASPTARSFSCQAGFAAKFSYPNNSLLPWSSCGHSFESTTALSHNDDIIAHTSFLSPFQLCHVFHSSPLLCPLRSLRLTPSPSAPICVHLRLLQFRVLSVFRGYPHH